MTNEREQDEQAGTQITDLPQQAPTSEQEEEAGEVRGGTVAHVSMKLPKASPTLILA